MADEVTFEITGLTELEEKLADLAPNIAKRGLRSALRAGGMVFKRALMSKAPVNVAPTPQAPAGFLASNFDVRTKILSGDLAGAAYIGPKGKMDYPYYASGAYRVKRNKRGKAIRVGRIAVASVARFLQFGTSKLAKRPFMTQAFDTSTNQAIEAVKVQLEKVVNP